MVINKIGVLLLGVKNEKLAVGLEKNVWRKERQNLAEADRGSCYNQEEWQQEFLDDKGAFYDGGESNNSENDDENYTENIEAVVRGRSSKLVFLKTSQISQENTSVVVSF